MFSLLDVQELTKTIPLIQGSREALHFESRMNVNCIYYIFPFPLKRTFVLYSDIKIYYCYSATCEMVHSDVDLFALRQHLRHLSITNQLSYDVYFSAL